MAPLAIYAAQRGAVVSGGDDALPPLVADWLRRSGVVLATVPPPGVELVVRSSALKMGHRWCRWAEQTGCRLLRRGEFLAQVALERRLVAVVGSHGKTSTTARLIQECLAAGLGIDFVLGGFFRDPELPPGSAHAGAEWLVAEVDESDGTIEQFSPEVTVLVNSDWDHPDRYPDPASLSAAFGRLVGRTRQALVCPAAEADSWREVVAPGVSVVAVGVGSDSRRSAEGGSELGGRVTSGWSFQEGNAALAAEALRWMVSQSAGGRSEVAPRSGSAGAVVRWSGVHRRQEWLMEEGAWRVMSDYAHHPAELRALLATGRPDFLVFQPHRYSRTARFAADFRSALATAREGVRVALLPVYPAGEAPEDGGTAEAVAEGTAWPVWSRSEARRVLGEALLGATEECPLTVWMVGAGDIDPWARRLVDDVALLRRWRARLSVETLLRLEEPLAPKTTLRVGGDARFYAEPAGQSDLRGLLALAREAAVPVFLLGRGSNLVVADSGFPGLAVAFRHPFWRRIEVTAEGRFLVGAGVRLKELCAAAAREGWAGLEFMEGIPGCVGGSLVMNAGAMGGWIGDVVETVEVLDLGGGEVETLRGAELQAGYRCCPGLNGKVVLGATLRATARAKPEAILGRMAALSEQRKASQPREASAGCFFKNPPGGHAGAWIDQAGLKGHAVGPAEVSGVHANFIVNQGGATAADVLAVARHARRAVAEARGVWLEPEPLLVGLSWEEVWGDAVERSDGGAATVAGREIFSGIDSLDEEPGGGQ